MDRDYYLSIIKNRMGERRYIHSVNVSKAAVKLAKIYGADAKKAELAGILHDSCKEIDKKLMLQIISNGGIILDDTQKHSSKLWHAIAGSVYVRDTLGINDDDIINSIRYHTSGRANMSILEKIIFTADFISDERDYDGVEIMREKAYRDIDEAMLFGLEFTISNLAQHNRLIHRDAVDCYNEILIKRKAV